MIVISDVHGCYKTLMALIEQLPDGEELCFVGDLIDRGPLSKDVVEFVKSNNHHCVKGNHEDMMSKDLKAVFEYGAPLFASQWYTHNGGQETLKSYHSPNDDELLIEHLNWMKDLPILLEFPDIKNEDEKHLIVSHSSVGEEQTEKSELHILWSRDDVKKAVSKSKDLMPLKENQFNIFGHTIQWKPRIGKNWACIDTGCFVKKKRKYDKNGFLTAIQFPSMKVYKQENID